MHFMADVVDCLAKVSLSFQSRNTTLGDVSEELQTAKAKLDTMRRFSGSHLKKVMGSNEFHGFQLKGVDNGFESARQSLLDLLQSCLSDRFEVDAEELNAMSLLNFNSWPVQLNDEPDFGIEHIEVLTKRWEDSLRTQNINIDEIGNQWVTLKVLVYKRFKSVQEVKWVQVHTMFKDRCGDLLGLIDLLLALPASSSEAERGFSVMKVTKTDWRSRLSDTRLSDLMTVKLQSNSIETFNPDDSINLWLNGKHRKPICMSSQTEDFSDEDEPTHELKQREEEFYANLQ